MSRWTDQFEKHPIHQTVKDLAGHLNVEFEGDNEECLLEKKRLNRFVTELKGTLERLDAEVVPFRLLDNINSYIRNRIIPDTQEFSRGSGSDKLRCVNELLEESPDSRYSLLCDLMVLKCAVLPIAEKSQIKEVSKLADKFSADIESRQSKSEQLSQKIEKFLAEQKSQLDELSAQVEEEQNKVNERMSNWSEKFSQAQEQRQKTYNQFQNEYQKNSDAIISRTEEETGEKIKNLIADFSERTETTLNKIIRDSEEKRKKILEFYQLVAGDSVAGSFSENAKEEKNQANIWRYVCISSVIIAVFWLIYCFEWGLENKNGWLG